MKKPQFVLGFELEGLVRHGYQADFDAGLRKVGRGIDRGTDGSVEGTFRIPLADREWNSDGTGYEDGNGIEIRTPPLEYSKATEMFAAILEYLGHWSEERLFKTNESCGLHVNLSEKKMVEDYNRFRKYYAHLVKHFPEHDVLKLFDRQNNNFCHPLFTRELKDTLTVEDIEERVRTRFLGCNKYHTLAMHAVGDVSYDVSQLRRIEFRCLGNTDYHKKSSKLDKALAIIIEAATEAFYDVVGQTHRKSEANEPQYA